MKRVVFAFIALAATAANAAAADLGRRQPYYPAPGPVYAPLFSWTGFYIGINGVAVSAARTGIQQAAGTSAAA